MKINDFRLSGRSSAASSRLLGRLGGRPRQLKTHRGPLETPGGGLRSVSKPSGAAGTAVRGLLGPCSGSLGLFWAGLGAVLGLSWAVLGLSWGPLGPSSSGLGSLLGGLGASESRNRDNAKNKKKTNEHQRFGPLGPL
eukprot:5030647-Pyramimonas_sp.AAC.1